MNQPQGNIPPHVPQQFGPPPQQFGPPPQQFGSPAQQFGPPIGAPRRPATPRPVVGGWWTASAVLAFIAAGSAVSLLGSIAVMVGFLGFFVGMMGGEEGLHQISNDFVRTTTWPFYLFLATQLVWILLGFWGGRNCLRGKVSGAFTTILLGALGVGEVVWLGIAFEEPGRMAVGIMAASALIVCPTIALRSARAPKTVVPGQPTAHPGLG